MTDMGEVRSSGPQASHSARPAHLHDFGGYLKDPQAIYTQSFDIVRQEAQLARFDAKTSELVIRLIHACGMVEIAEDLLISEDCVDVARNALVAGAPILCDVEMVSHGVIRRSLPCENAVICTLNAPETASLAKELGTTRSAAAVELWKNHLEGAVVAIGNAPTALFHLLEGLKAGWPRPAAIFGFPVGFVGATESKAALASRLDIPFATLPGRRGGSAMAAAAVNAISLGLNGDGL